MKPPVVAPFTLYSEQHVREFISQLDGQVIRAWGIAIPVSTFVNDLWQSAKREGYIEGYLQAQSAHYSDVYGHEPPASIVGDWRKQAGRKAMCSEDNVSF
jgi:hypothetical protein